MVVFREAYLKDFERILCLKRQVYSIHTQRAPDWFIDTDEPITLPEFQEMLKSEEWLVFVLADDEMVVAYAFAKVHETNDRLVLNSRQFFVLDFCVDEAHRRHRHGTRLMESLVKVAEKKKCESIELLVWDWNVEAKAFYQACGMRARTTRMARRLAVEVPAVIVPD